LQRHRGHVILINNIMTSTVLITTANKPAQGMQCLQMTSIAKRIITAKAAVFFWAAQGIEKIVIADASNQVLLDDKEVLLLNQIGTTIEQIYYAQDESLVAVKGKGYAEAELLNFAIENSNILKNENNFFKCTGKAYCLNFKKIQELIKQENIQSIFWKQIDPNSKQLLNCWIDTRFFYVEKMFFKQVILTEYLKTDERYNCAEQICFSTISQNLQTNQKLKPVISGFCGGIDAEYIDFNLSQEDYSFPCWTAY